MPRTSIRGHSSRVLHSVASAMAAGQCSCRNRAVFVYGSLMEPAVCTVLLGRMPTSRPALLHGYMRCRVVDKAYPAAIPHGGGVIEGLLLDGLSERDQKVRHRCRQPRYRGSSLGTAVPGQ
jgi:hypothetical protein